MKRGYSLRQLVHSSLIYSISDISLKLIGLFLVPVYTRAMTPAEYGVVGYTMAIGQIMTPLLGLGLVSSLPMLYYSYDEAERRRLIGSTVNIVLIYSLFCTSLLMLFGQSLFKAMAETVPFHPYGEIVIWTTFLAGFYYLPLGIFNMSDKPVAYLTYSLCLALLNVLLSLVFVIGFKQGALGVLWAGLITGFVGMVIAMLTIRENYQFVFDWGKIRALLVVALPVLPHLFSGTVLKFSDRLFLAGWTSLTSTGVYSLAMVLVSPILVIMGGIFTALNPMFYRRAAQQDELLRSDWRRLSTLYVLVGSMITLGVALFARELVELIAPDSYSSAEKIIPVLALAQLISGLYWLVSPGIGHARKTWVYPVASFIAVAANLTLNFLLIPVFGVVGAAWATVASALVQLYVFWKFSQRYFFIQYEYSQISKIIMLCLMVFMISEAILIQSFWLSSILKLLLMMIVLISLPVLGIINRSEMDSARRYLISYFRKV